MAFKLIFERSHKAKKQPKKATKKTNHKIIGNKKQTIDKTNGMSYFNKWRCFHGFI
ncbi:hypothetical protein PESHB5_01870 [Pediococcus parvulus]